MSLLVAPSQSHLSPPNLSIGAANGGRVASGPRRRVSERAVIDRLQQFRVVPPAMAQETAVARREAFRLRTENARLTRRLAELEASDRT
jgi:hypothetical protein